MANFEEDRMSFTKFGLGKFQIHAESMSNLSGDHIKVSHKYLNNKSHQQISPDSQLNAKNKKSKIYLRKTRKIGISDLERIEQVSTKNLIFGLLHHIRLEATPNLLKTLEGKKITSKILHFSPSLTYQRLSNTNEKSTT